MGHPLWAAVSTSERGGLKRWLLNIFLRADRWHLGALKCNFMDIFRRTSRSRCSADPRKPLTPSRGGFSLLCYSLNLPFQMCWPPDAAWLLHSLWQLPPWGSSATAVTP